MVPTTVLESVSTLNIVVGFHLLTSYLEELAIHVSNACGRILPVVDDAGVER